MEPGQQLPPPSLLKRKIIIKNKKKHHHHHHHKKHHKSQEAQAQGIDEENQEVENNGIVNQAGEIGPPPDIIPQNEVVEVIAVTNNSELQVCHEEIPHALMLQQRQGSKDSTQDDEGLYIM